MKPSADVGFHMTKAQVKRFLPNPLVQVIRNTRISRLRRKFGRMDRKQAFSAIYQEACWGQNSDNPFCSGHGSADAFAASYNDIVTSYILTEEIRSVVDLGCGDFRIGRRLCILPIEYCGVDIVSELVTYNSRQYGNERITFKCLDIVEDQLPTAELCLIRQVLQHLSNIEIASVLKKLGKYRHVIITEHIPSFEAGFQNRDKPHGPDTRIIDGSGVYIEAPPFTCKVASVWEHPYDKRTKIVSSLLRNA